MTAGLFAAAVTIWFTTIVLLFIRRNDLAGLLNDLRRAFIPNKSAIAATPLRVAA